MIKAFFDGAINKNPGGRIGFGAVVYKDNKNIWEKFSGIEERHYHTNNYSEYKGLELILDYLLEGKHDGEAVCIHGDCEMAITQMTGFKKIGAGAYKDIAERCKAKVKKIGLKVKLSFKWIPRRDNGYADQLSRQHFLTPTISQYSKFF